MRQRQYRRGIRADQDLFGNAMDREERTQKGRDAKLIEDRNVYMYHLYYYSRNLMEKSYEEAMLFLSKKVFLSIDTVPRIIGEYTVEIRRLMNEQMTVDQLREKYPEVWQEPVKKPLNNGIAEK